MQNFDSQGTFESKGLTWFLVYNLLPRKLLKSVLLGGKLSVTHLSLGAVIFQEIENTCKFINVFHLFR